MLIGSREADPFLSAVHDEISVYLFYGNDEGLAADRAAKIVAARVDRSDPFCSVRFTASELAADPQRFLDEAFTVPLFAATRCISVDAMAATQIPGLDVFLQSPPESVLVVIAAGSLRKDSPLISLCAPSRRAAAIECALAEGDAILQLVDETLAVEGLSITEPARRRLGLLLASDRLSASSELDKLVSLAHGKSTIEMEDIEAVVSDASSSGHEHIISAAFSGRFQTEALKWELLTSPAAEAQRLLSSALRQAIYFHQNGVRNSGARSPGGARSRRWIRLLAEAVRRSRREPDLASAITWKCLAAISNEAGDSGI